MPLISVTVAPGVTDEHKRKLREALPHIASEAVACQVEPYDGDLQPGDVIVRMFEPAVHDRFDIDVLVEVLSKWFPEREINMQARTDHIQQSLKKLLPELQVGVYLSLPVAAWAQ